MNKLKKVKISGFKSISTANPLTLEFGDINILLGANGAGKSNIVSFFKMVGYMMNDSLQMFIAQHGTNQKFLYYGSKVTPCLSAEIQTESRKWLDIYRFSLTHAIPNRLIINSEEVECENKETEEAPYTKQIPSDFMESGLRASTDETCKSVKNILAKCKVYQFSDSSMSSPMRQASTVDSARYLQTEANNLASFLLYLKNNYEEAYRRIVTYIQCVMPQFKDFYLEPSRGYVTLNWVDTSANDYVLSADQFSDGSIRFIALATLLLQPKDTLPSIIIIDEPELGLHPYAIDQLAEMIREAALNAQVIVATQSPALIDNFSMSDITVIERDEDTDSTTARKMDEETYSEWLKNYAISELWDKNVIGGRPL